TMTWQLRAVEEGPFTLTSEWSGYDESGDVAGPSEGEVSGVAGAAELEVSVEADPDKAAPGEEIEVTITVTNTSADTVTDITAELDAEWEPAESSLDEPEVSDVAPASATLAPEAET